MISLWYTEIIRGMGSTNERWRYHVTSSPIGWAHTQNDPWVRQTPGYRTLHELSIQIHRPKHIFRRFGSWAHKLSVTCVPDPNLVKTAPQSSCPDATAVLPRHRSPDAEPHNIRWRVNRPSAALRRESILRSHGKHGLAVRSAEHECILWSPPPRYGLAGVGIFGRRLVLPGHVGQLKKWREILTSLSYM